MEHRSVLEIGTISASASDDIAPILKDIGAWLINLSGEGQSAPVRPAMLREAPTRQNDEEFLARMARDEYRWRQQRRKYLDDDFFGEPGWDILLDLYVSKVHGRSISVSSACIASGVPPTTALRWLSLMQERGLLVRKEDEADRRRHWVSITAEGLAVMNSYLLAKARWQTGCELSVPTTIPRRAQS